VKGKSPHTTSSCSTFKSLTTKTNELEGLGPTEYNIIENLKNTKASISLYELLKFYPFQKDFLKVVEVSPIKRVKDISQNKDSGVDNRKPSIDIVALIGNKSS
jgi:hypothetical protein